MRPPSFKTRGTIGDKITQINRIGNSLNHYCGYSNVKDVCISQVYWNVCKQTIANYIMKRHNNNCEKKYSHTFIYSSSAT